MQAFQESLWLAIAASIALTALLGWIAARRGLAPVREMADLTQGISAHRLGERLPPESVPTELVDLAISFNDMLARLEGSFRRLSDFSSDLAHELRTPISNLMTQTQVAITNSIVEAHKGTIRIFSSNGATRFAITFPAAGAGP